MTIRTGWGPNFPVANGAVAPPDPLPVGSDHTVKRRQMQTILKDSLTWAAGLVAALGAGVLVWQFPLTGALALLPWGLAAALFVGWIGLAATTGRYRRLGHHAASASARAWSDRQARRVDALKLSFQRLNDEAGGRLTEDLARNYTAFGRALGMRPPADTRRWGAAGRSTYERGLTLLEDLSVVLNTLSAAGKDQGSEPRVAELLEATEGQAGALLGAASALSDGRHDTLPPALEALEGRT
ncbi:MAG: hypothetical protein AAFU80_07460 [Pseudomonadota bacterium]